MTLPELVMLAVVIFAGMAASPWNVTAAALTASWAIAQGVWLATGDNLPLTVYMMCDIAVLGLIYCKPPVRCLCPYKNKRDQAVAIITQKSIGDRVVILIFPVMWAFYIAPISDFLRWWMLYGLAVAQFMAAGIETGLKLLAWHRGEEEPIVPPLWVFRRGKEGVA